MENDYIKQIKLLRQLDSFNSNIEKMMEDVSSETSMDLLRDTIKYIKSRKKYYELQTRDSIDKILYEAIENQLKETGEGYLFKASYLRPKLKEIEVNTSDVVRVLKRNKPGLGVVSLYVANFYNIYWMKPSDSEGGQFLNISELAEKLKKIGGYGNKKQVRYTSKKILENLTEKGFSGYNDYYFLEIERGISNPKHKYEVCRSDEERGKKLIRDAMKIMRLFPGRLNNEIVVVYHPKIIRQRQY